MTTTQQILSIITAIIALQFCRHIAFIAFPAHKPVPKFVQYLGKALPSAVFGLLVVYCYKNIDVLSGHHGLPEFIAGILVVILHAWRHNMFLSIGVGTCAYMFLVQKIFI